MLKTYYNIYKQDCQPLYVFLQKASISLHSEFMRTCRNMEFLIKARVFIKFMVLWKRLEFQELQTPCLKSQSFEII